MDWKPTWKVEFQSNVIDDVRNKIVSAYCIVKKTTNDLGFQSCRLMLHGLKPYSINQ